MKTREQGIFEAVVAEAAGVSLQQLHVDYAVDVPGLLGHMEVSLRMTLVPGVSCGAVAASVREAIQSGLLLHVWIYVCTFRMDIYMYMGHMCGTCIWDMYISTLAPYLSSCGAVAASVKSFSAVFQHIQGWIYSAIVHIQMYTYVCFYIWIYAYMYIYTYIYI